MTNMKNKYLLLSLSVIIGLISVFFLTKFNKESSKYTPRNILGILPGKDWDKENQIGKEIN